MMRYLLLLLLLGVLVNRSLCQDSSESEDDGGAGSQGDNSGSENDNDNGGDDDSGGGDDNNGDEDSGGDDDDNGDEDSGGGDDGSGSDDDNGDEGSSGGDDGSGGDDDNGDEGSGGDDDGSGGDGSGNDGDAQEIVRHLSYKFSVEVLYAIFAPPGVNDKHPRAELQKTVFSEEYEEFTFALIVNTYKQKEEGTIFQSDNLQLFVKPNQGEDDNSGYIRIKYGDQEYRSHNSILDQKNGEIVCSYSSGRWTLEMSVEGKNSKEEFQGDFKLQRNSKFTLYQSKEGEQYTKGLSGLIVNFNFFNKIYSLDDVQSEKTDKSALILDWDKEKDNWQVEDDAIIVQTDGGQEGGGGGSSGQIKQSQGKDVGDGSDQKYEVEFSESGEGSAVFTSSSLKQSYQEFSMFSYLYSTYSESETTLFTYDTLVITSRSSQSQDDSGEIKIRYQEQEYSFKRGFQVSQWSLLVISFSGSTIKITMGQGETRYSQEFQTQVSEWKFDSQQVVIGKGSSSGKGFIGKVRGFYFSQQSVEFEQVVSEEYEQQSLLISWSSSESSVSGGAKKEQISSNGGGSSEDGSGEGGSGDIEKSSGDDVGDGSDQSFEINFADSGESYASYQSSSLQKSYSELSFFVFSYSTSESEAVIINYDKLVVTSRSSSDDESQGEIVIKYQDKEYHFKRGFLIQTWYLFFFSFSESKFTITIAQGKNRYTEVFQTQFTELSFSTEELDLGKSSGGSKGFVGKMRGFYFSQTAYEFEQVVNHQYEEQTMIISWSSSKATLSGGAQKEQISSSGGGSSGGGSDEGGSSEGGSGEGGSSEGGSSEGGSGEGGSGEGGSSEGGSGEGGSGEEGSGEGGSGEGGSSEGGSGEGGSGEDGSGEGGSGEGGSGEGGSGEGGSGEGGSSEGGSSEGGSSEGGSTGGSREIEESSGEDVGDGSDQKYEFEFSESGEGSAVYSISSDQESYEAFSFFFYAYSTYSESETVLFTYGSFIVTSRSVSSEESQGAIVIKYQGKEYQFKQGFQMKEWYLVLISFSGGKLTVTVGQGTKRYLEVFNIEVTEFTFSSNELIIGRSSERSKGFIGKIRGFYFSQQSYTFKQVVSHQYEQSSFVISWSSSKARLSGGARRLEIEGGGDNCSDHEEDSEIEVLNFEDYNDGSDEGYEIVLSESGQSSASIERTSIQETTSSFSMSFFVTSTSVREGSVVTIGKFSISSRSRKRNDDNDKGDIIIRYGSEEYHMNLGTHVGETSRIISSYRESQFILVIVIRGKVYRKVFKTKSRELSFGSTTVVIGKSEEHSGFSGSFTGFTFFKKAYTAKQVIKEEYQIESISISWQKSSDSWSYAGGSKKGKTYIEDTDDGSEEGYEIYFSGSEHGSATLTQTKLKQSYKQMSINIFVKSKSTEQYTIYKIGDLELQSRSKEEDDENDEGDVIIRYEGEEFRTNYGTVVGKSSRIFFKYSSSSFTISISGSGRSFSKTFISKSKEIRFTQTNVLLGYSENSRSSYQGSLIGFAFYEISYSVTAVIEQRVQEKYTSISWSKSSWQTSGGAKKRKLIIKDTDDGSDEGVELYYPDSGEGTAVYEAKSLRESYSEFTVNIFITSYNEKESIIYSIGDFKIKSRSKKQNDDNDEGDVVIVYGEEQYSTKYGTATGATSRILVTFWQGVYTVTVSGSSRSFKKEFRSQSKEVKFSHKEVVLGKGYSGTIRGFTFYERYYTISQVTSKRTEKRYIQISCDSEWKLSGGAERRQIEDVPEDYDDGHDEEYELSFPSSGQGGATTESESFSEITNEYSLFTFVKATSKEETILFYGEESHSVSLRAVEEDDGDEGDLIIRCDGNEYHTYYGTVVDTTSRITIIFKENVLTVAITGGGRNYKRQFHVQPKSKPFERSFSFGSDHGKKGFSGTIIGLHIFKKAYTLSEIITKKYDSSSAVIEWKEVSWKLSGGAVKEMIERDDEKYEIIFPKNGKGYAELEDASFKESYEEFSVSVYVTSSNVKNYGSVVSYGNHFSVQVKSSHGHDEGDVLVTVNGQKFQTHYGFARNRQSLLVISYVQGKGYRVQIAGSGRKYDKVFDSESNGLRFSQDEKFSLGHGFKGSLSGFYMYSKAYSIEEVQEKKIDENSYIINWNTAKFKVRNGAIITRNGYGISFQRSLSKHPRAILQNRKISGKASTFTVILSVLLGTVGGGTIVSIGEDFAVQASPRYSFYNGDVMVHHHGEDFHTHYGLDSHSVAFIVLGFNKGFWSIEIGEKGKLLYNATFTDSRNSYYFSEKKSSVVLGQRAKGKTYSHGFVGVITTYSAAVGKLYSFRDVIQKKVDKSYLVTDWQTAIWKLEDGAEILDDERSRHHRNGILFDGFLFDYSEEKHGNGFLDWLHGDHDKDNDGDDDDGNGRNHGGKGSDEDGDGDDDDGHGHNHGGKGSDEDGGDDDDGHGRNHGGKGHEDGDGDDDDGHGRNHGGKGSHEDGDDDDDGHGHKHGGKGSHEDGDDDHDDDRHGHEHGGKGSHGDDEDHHGHGGEGSHEHGDD